MATARQPTSPPGYHPAGGRRLQQGLLACGGLISSLLWPISGEVLAAWLYQGYDSISQTVSELSSLGAPTRPFMLVEGALYSALLVAFGIGVGRAATDNRSLRITGALLLAYGAVGPLWYPFPVTARANITPGATFVLTDVMHIVLGAVERTYLDAFLLWVAVLSVTLVRSVPSEHT
jgi:hypothetical protein